jgi:hypothetical protein
MHGAVMIRWGANVPGRETTGLEVFGRALNRFEGMTKERKAACKVTASTSRSPGATVDSCS